VEPDRSVIDVNQLLKSNQEKKGDFDFNFLFCCQRQRQISAKSFVASFFKVELGISIGCVVLSIVALLYGITYFTVDPSFDKDNQLIGIACGITGLMFSGFKFYFTLMALKFIKREIFVAEIPCAAGLSVLTQVVLLVTCLVFLLLSVLVGMKDYFSGESRKTDEEKTERIFGLVLLISSLPMLFLTLVIVSQTVLMRQLTKAVDIYMSEYINNSDVRKKADEEKKKEKIR